jgi:hypothetical protein
LDKRLQSRPGMSFLDQAWPILVDSGRDVTLVGVRIPTPHVPVPPELRAEIGKKLTTLTFHVSHDRQHSKWTQKMRDKGKSAEWIQTNALKHYRNRRVFKRDKTRMICWTADDPQDYSFEHTNANGEKEQTTVFKYYQASYGITLKYPKMPLVRVSENEYFPVEFLTYGK